MGHQFSKSEQGLLWFSFGENELLGPVLLIYAAQRHNCLNVVLKRFDCTVASHISPSAQTFLHHMALDGELIAICQFMQSCRFSQWKVLCRTPSPTAVRGCVKHLQYLDLPNLCTIRQNSIRQVYGAKAMLLHWWLLLSLVQPMKDR